MSEKLIRFSISPSVVQPYFQSLSSEPDGTYILLDDASASALSGHFPGDGINKRYLSASLNRRPEPAFTNREPCVVLMKQTSSNGDLCLAATIYRQGYKPHTPDPVMKKDPGLLSSDYVSCVFFQDLHADLSGTRYECDLSAYQNALKNTLRMKPYTPADCQGNSNLTYWHDNAQKGYHGICDYIKSGRQIIRT